MQEAETLSVQDMPRSASSLSVRTDASGVAVIYLKTNFIIFINKKSIIYQRYMSCIICNLIS